MKTLTKTFLGAAMLAGTALAASEPASAQPYDRGDNYYGRSYERGYDSRGYDDRGYDDRGYGDRGYGDYGRGYYGYGSNWRNTRYCTSPRFGRWQFDPRLQRRVFVPHRWVVLSGRLRDCMYITNRSGGPSILFR